MLATATRSRKLERADALDSGVSVKMIRHHESMGLLPIVCQLKTKIGELKAMVYKLERLSNHCHGGHRPECPILDDLGSNWF